MSLEFNKSKRSVIYAVCAAALALAACSAPEPAPAPPPAVLAAPAQSASASWTDVSGTLRSTGLHDLAAENGGVVLRLHADVGDRVRAGQVLAVLDPEPARLNMNRASAQRDSATARRDSARREVERMEQLLAAGAVSPQQLDQARAAARTAEAEQAAAEAEAGLAARALERSIIRAPAAGVVTARDAALSANVAPGAVLFRIDAGGRREILAPVPGRVAEALRSGQTVPFRFGDQEGVARVTAISTSARGADVRTVRLSVERGDAPDGAAVTLRFAAGGDTGAAVTVPLSALVTRRDGSRQVMVIGAEQKLVAVPVEVVSVSSAGALVHGAVTPGQPVVAAGAGRVRPGQTVRPLPYAA